MLLKWRPLTRKRQMYKSTKPRLTSSQSWSKTTLTLLTWDMTFLTTTNLLTSVSITPLTTPKTSRHNLTHYAPRTSNSITLSTVTLNRLRCHKILLLLVFTNHLNKEETGHTLTCTTTPWITSTNHSRWSCRPSKEWRKPSHQTTCCSTSGSNLSSNHDLLALLYTTHTYVFT
jgi:hypothetical protein